MRVSKPRSRELGRGLSALMADVMTNTDINKTMPGMQSSVSSVPIENIHPNPDQPRRIFKSDNLDDLANSIRTTGVLQPLLVRPSSKGPDHYEIIAGERRWRASQIAQIHELPVIIKDFSDKEVL